MKGYRFIIMTLLSGLFVIRCNDLEPVKHYSVSGWLMDSDINKPIPGVIVNIDNQIDTTDNNGIYAFSSISEGQHIISVSLPTYETYSEKINITRDTLLSIYLKGSKFVDYFPIKLGTIKYKYIELDEHNSHYFSNYGEASWNIHSTYTRNDSAFYEVTETLAYTTNSVSQKDITRDFKIIEAPSHKIYITRSLPHCGHLPLFNRYINENQSDIVEFISSNCTFQLKRNVGLSYIYCTDGSGRFWSYRLIE